MTNSYQLDLVATAGHLKAILLAKTASRTRAQAACELISCLTCTSHLTADTVKKNQSLFAQSDIFSTSDVLG